MSTPPRPIQTPLNLFLPLKDGHAPDVADLLMRLDASEPNPVHVALARLGNVHGAQFVLKTFDKTAFLAVLTSYDSSFDDYILSFVEAIGTIFDKILQHVEGWDGTTPVRERSAEFLEFLRVHDARSLGRYSAYPDARVFDVRSALGMAPAVPVTSPRVPPLPTRPVAGIQSLILNAPKQEHLRYHFFRIDEPTLARRFVREFSAGGRFAVHLGPELPAPTATTYYLGVTAVGLHVLGTSLDSFPKAFVDGAKARALMLGDRGPSSPLHWDLAHDDIDLCVLLYAGTPQALDTASTSLIQSAQASGCRPVDARDGRALAAPDAEGATKRREHFGFVDGISQPRLEGLHKAKPGEHPVPIGMFVLGRPDTRPDGAAVTHSPVPKPLDLANDGTFGAFRIMEQDRAAFDAFLDANAGTPARRELLAAKVVGRFRDGRPLADPHAVTASNDFDYANDPGGQLCPIGAHTRRAYPRSSPALGAAGQRARLIRRGMTYGPPFDEAPDAKRGVLGLFLCVDIEHQFEFVLKNWINDGLFAPGVPPQEADPLAGAHGPCATFSHPDGRGAVSHRLSQFVTTRGAVYLFFPSVTGIRHLAQPGPASSRSSRASSTDGTAEESARGPSEDAATIVANVRENARKLGSRDAHPRHHGIVRATFTVAAGLDPTLQQGIFARPGATFPAYVRFSNGRPGGVHDAAPDARGMAIKLMGVEGTPVLDGDELRTQDFILVAHPTFFVPNLAEYLRFQRSSKAPAVLARNFPLVLPSFPSIENPLATVYFSQTAYALGERLAVKYSARPVEPPERPRLSPAEIERRFGDDPRYLQKAMAQYLHDHDATFEFRVQTRPGHDGREVDDPTIEWTQPWTTVATLTIPPQEFLFARQLAFAEHISYSPWHAKKDHRPLGPINMVRREAYLASREARYAATHSAPAEPTGDEKF